MCMALALSRSVDLLRIIFRNISIHYEHFLSCSRTIQTLLSWNNTISNLQVRIKKWWKVPFIAKCDTYLVKKSNISFISEFLSTELYLEDKYNWNLKTRVKHFNQKKVEFYNLDIISFLATTNFHKKLITILSEAEADVLNINTEIQRMISKCTIIFDTQ